MIEINIVNIIGVAILAVMIAHWYTPIQEVKNKIISRIPFVNQIFNCSKCSGFVLGIVIFHNIFIAALTSFLGFVISYIIDRIDSWYE